jgi:hypothetical protein
MIRKTILLFCILLLTLNVAAFARESISPAMQVTLLNQDPDPVGSGQYVDIKYKVENLGSGVARNFTIKFIPRYPFVLDTNQESVVLVGSVGGYQDEEEAPIVEFKVRVDDRAVGGDNEVEIEYTYLEASRKQTFRREDNIRVQEIDAILAIQEVSINPEELAPGEHGTVAIRVANLATTALRDISLKLDLADNTLPIAPVGSATEKKLSVLSAGETATFSFKVIPYPSAVSGIYKVPINITYFDDLNNKFTQLDVIGLIVGDEPDISIVLDQVSLMQGFQKGIVPVKIVNKHVVDVKFLDVTVKEDSSFTLLSPKENYIGNLDSDDFETLDIEVFNKNKEASSIKVPLSVVYRDANNNQFEQEVVIEVQLLGVDVQQKEKTSPVTYLIILVVIGFIAYFFWRRHKHKKEAESNNK